MFVELTNGYCGESFNWFAGRFQVLPRLLATDPTLHFGIFDGNSIKCASKAWHANEVLQDGPLIHDMSRCEQIPEMSRGNDTKATWSQEKTAVIPTSPCICPSPCVCVCVCVLVSSYVKKECLHCTGDLSHCPLHALGTLGTNRR